METKILLVRPPPPKGVPRTEWPPIGISYIASYLLARNPKISVKAIDFAVEQFSPERWRRELALNQPDIVGISMLTLDATAGMRLAQLTKEIDPRIVTVCGGAHASLVPHQCLDHCDIVVRGEGEETFYDIVQGHHLDTIMGVSYLRDGKPFDTLFRGRIENLDSLPFPLYSLFKMEKYLEHQYLGPGFRIGIVLSSRGCPYGCTFCASQLFWGRTIRFRSAKNVVDEMEVLQGQYGLNRIDFWDDAINIPQRRAFEICDEITQRGCHTKIQFCTLMRANRSTVSLELFQRMKEANFAQVSLGIESASPRVLKAMRKNLTPEEASRAIQMARRAGVSSVLGNFMVGNWDETLWDVLKTWRFILSNDVEPRIWICTPYPGTEFSHRLMEAGYRWTKLSPGAYTATARTNKMPKHLITLVFLLSMVLQRAVYLFRYRRFKDFFPFWKRALVQLWWKVGHEPDDHTR